MRKRQLCLWAGLVFFCLALLVAGAAMAAERYTVKPGDSLHKIAKKFHVSVDALKEANHLEGNALRPKQVLIIPGGKICKKNRGEKHGKAQDRHGHDGLCREEGRHSCRGVGKDGRARIGDQEDKRASVIEAQSGTAARPGKTSRKGG